MLIKPLHYHQPLHHIFIQTINNVWVYFNWVRIGNINKFYEISICHVKKILNGTSYKVFMSKQKYVISNEVLLGQFIDSSPPYDSSHNTTYVN